MLLLVARFFTVLLQLLLILLKEGWFVSVVAAVAALVNTGVIVVDGGTTWKIFCVTLDRRDDDFPSVLVRCCCLRDEMVLELVTTNEVTVGEGDETILHVDDTLLTPPEEEEGVVVEEVEEEEGAIALVEGVTLVTVTLGDVKCADALDVSAIGAIDLEILYDGLDGAFEVLVITDWQWLALNNLRALSYFSFSISYNLEYVLFCSGGKIFHWLASALVNSCLLDGSTFPLLSLFNCSWIVERFIWQNKRYGLIGFFGGTGVANAVASVDAEDEHILLLLEWWFCCPLATEAIEEEMLDEFFAFLLDVALLHVVTIDVLDGKLNWVTWITGAILLVEHASSFPSTLICCFFTSSFFTSM